MPNLFSRLNYEVPFPGAEYLNESDVSRVVTPVLTPQQGFVNWFFGGSDISLISYDGTHTLTEAHTSLTKTYGEFYVELPANAAQLLNGLRTEYGDANSQTICAAIRYSGEPSQVLLGSMSGSSGECLQMTGAGAIAYSYKSASTGATVATVVPVPAGLTAGDDIFIAISRTGDNVTAFVGGAVSKLTLTGAAKMTDQNLKMGVGNCNFSTTAGYSKLLRCYEFLYSATAMTESQLDAVYANSVTRCALRGISLM
ncbi:hypothetical protein [Raoultella sp. FYR_9]|uniref:hypothetical protein n=1 Tax=Raoultella sp. FYR_9 TaxID=3367176 RepID=UPI00370C88BA